MSTARRQRLARLTLVLFVGACAWWLGRLDYQQKISTNVLDLVPASEQSPEVDLVRGFANDVQSRVMLFALRDSAAPGEAPMEAAQAFARELVDSRLFVEAQVLGDTASQDQLGRAVFERRFALLLPAWLGEREREFRTSGRPPEDYSRWLAERTATELEEYLAQPEAVALHQVIQQDPLLLVPRLAEQARLVAPATSDNGGHALIWARIEPSPLDESGQQPVFAAVEAAWSHLRERRPSLELRWSGVNRFAAASRARIEAELRYLNLFSIAGVLGVSALFVRRVHKVLHLAPVILLSIAGAWTMSTLLFDRLHILVFVIGSLLSGVAIDYGVYIYMQPLLSATETYGGKLRRLLKPLLASCLTTVIGFSLLLLSDLPLIQQIGAFVASGLICALAAAMVYFAQFERPVLEARLAAPLALPGSSDRWRWLPRALFGAAVAIAVIGPWQLRWRDDIRELEIPAPELRDNEATLRSLFGDTAERTVYLTYGGSLAAARQNLAAFHAHLASVTPDAPRSSLGLLLPTEADWRALPQHLSKLPEFSADLRAALAQHGFAPQSFRDFFEAWERNRREPPGGDYAAVTQQFTSLLRGPLALLASTRAPYWFLTIVEQPAEVAVAPSLATVGVNQLQSLNDLFTRYRWSALQLSVAGLGLVILSVFVIYPLKRAIRIALIPAGSCLVVFGLFGLTGQTLNLFNLLGAFLGVCLSHNYAIFSAENSGAGGAPPVSIRLSALSTVTSFGVLSLSQIPVIHSLGLTVACIVLTALVAVELEPVARRHFDA